MKRVLLRSLMLFVLLGTIAWCVSAQSVTLQFLVWGSAENVTIRERIVAEFEKKHPDIKVETIYAPTGYADKLHTMIAAGVTPDVFWASYGDIPAYVSQDLLLDLTPFTRKDAEFQSYVGDYIPAVLEGYRYRGGMYGLPNAFNPQVLYFNKDLLEKRGVPLPNQSLPWNLFVQNAQKLTDETHWGYADANAYLPYIWQAGGDLWDSQGRSMVGTPASVRGLSFKQDLIYRHRVQPQPYITGRPSDLQAFLDGTVAMYMDGGWRVPRLLQTNLNWGIGMLPKDEREATELLYDGGVVYKRTRFPEAAWKLVKFYSGPEGQRINAEMTQLTTPVLRSTVQRSLSGNADLQVAMQRRMQQAMVGRLRPSLVRNSDFGTVVNQVIPRLLRNEIAPRVAAELIDQGLRPILAAEFGKGE